MVGICLSNGMVTVVDDQDVALIIGYTWYAWKGGKTYYACAHVPGSGRHGRTVYLHRLIAGQNDLVVDHIDRNGLNNSRSNLNPCVQAENLRNGSAFTNSKTGVRGVSKHRSKFIARRMRNGVDVYLGSYNTIAEAKAAYEEDIKKRGR